MRERKSQIVETYESPDSGVETVEKRVRKGIRAGITGGRNILTVQGLDPEFHYCWVTDFNGKVEHFLEMGYDFESRDLVFGEKSVEQGSGKADSRVAKNVGGGMVAYLMKYPKNEWERDMNAIQRELDLQEREWKSNLNSGKNGTYGKVDIEQKDYA